MTKHTTLNIHSLSLGASAMIQKGNVVLYLDKNLVEKSKELGFNLSKTFENHLKQLISQLSNNQTTHNGLPSKSESNWWAGPDLPPVRYESLCLNPFNNAIFINFDQGLELPVPIPERDCVITKLLFKKLLICLQKAVVGQAVFSNYEAIFKIKTDFFRSLERVQNLIQTKGDTLLVSNRWRPKRLKTLLTTVKKSRP